MLAAPQPSLSRSGLPVASVEAGTDARVDVRSRLRVQLMSRRPLTDEEMAERRAQQVPMSDRAGSAQLDLAVAKARRLVADKREDAAPETAAVLVGLHAVFAESCYGALPDELRGRGYFAAHAAMRSLVAEEFPGEVGLADCAAFLAWAWAREIAREKQRRAEAKEDGGRRLGWALVFGKARLVLGDWKVAMQRRRGAKVGA